MKKIRKLWKYNCSKIWFSKRKTTL